jgi:hypothetical protein
MVQFRRIAVFHRLLPFMLFQLGLMISTLSQAGGYELGQGWHAGDFYLSGYTDIEAVDNFGASASLDLDDLSLFASGHVNQWMNPFMEAELSSRTLVRQGGEVGHGNAIVERFYNDIIFSERDTLRIGKTLTPLGEWNLVHAAPLVPLVTRPYSTGEGFDLYMSGISWQHDPGSESIPSLQFYWQPDTEWFKRPSSLAPRNFHNVYGGHLSWPLGMIDKIGVSAQHGQFIETGETFTLYGFNVSKTFGKLRLESEALTARFSGTVLPGASPRLHDNEAGIFVLAEYAIAPQWHGILEAEHYQDHMVDQASRSVTVAATYKPSVPTIWKLEYVHQAGVPASIAAMPTGITASFSFLF